MPNVLLFFNMGGGEVIIILLVVLLFFGSDKIPELARGLGKGIRQFKDAANDVQSGINETIREVKTDIDTNRQEFKKNLDFKIDDNSKEAPVEKGGVDKN